ncbi:GNAT family N-acetyltransferase [Paenibacillus caseinilyticus]|uniref:GNAT family acetyltransferase n=1 Tax=Paenibacillus mucilaginosus K02 TaxID=997761 RepID=I0BNH0_9BACL|nr:GNAT family N-acetyltransferase [Paenibacillus mucilaginosus]AFH63917.1 GNAT family acetyltransferase [Paenibacillus mucilaginosus K02]
MELIFRTELPGQEDYYRLYQSTGWEPEKNWTPERLHQALRGSWYLVACYRNGQLAASGRLVSDGIHQCFVCDLIVLPDFRGQGIGGRILEQLLDHCRSRGIRWVQLACAKGKRGFYEKYGFTARAPDAPGMNLFL